ncbi:hypothetical protein HDV05_004014 [Chytridiales sp. JEL 0842]|nr:hypothetical protein HDV05_004014 [Chytridiales sp. JEL 0842]
MIVIAARGLSIKDRYSSDPFAIIKIGDQTHRTPVIYKNLNPVWNYECSFVVTPVLMDADLELTVWDKDLIGKDFLGQLVIPLSEVFFTPFDDAANPAVWHILSPRTPKDKITGDIQIKCGYEGDLSSELQQMQNIVSLRKQSHHATLVSSEDLEDDVYFNHTINPSRTSTSTRPIDPKNRLSVVIEEPDGNAQTLSKAANFLTVSTDQLSPEATSPSAAESGGFLKAMMSIELISGALITTDNTPADPFVVLTFGNKKSFRTRIQRHTLNPVWNERVILHLRHADCQQGSVVRLFVYDFDKHQTQYLIGSANLSIYDIIRNCPQLDVVPNEVTEIEPVPLTVRLFSRPSTYGHPGKEPGNSSTLSIRVTFVEYPELRRNFFVSMLKMFDSNRDNRINKVELTTMLDSLGSTLSDDSISYMFLLEDKTAPEPEIFIEEAAMQLEKKINQNYEPTGGGLVGIPGGGSSKPQRLFRHHDEHVIQLNECPYCAKGVRLKADLDAISHVALCFYENMANADIFVMGGLLAESGTSKKWYTKILSMVAYGRRSIGKNKENVIIHDRATGQLFEEKMPVYVRMGMRLLYQAAASENPDDIERVKSLLRSWSIRQGEKFNHPSSKEEIKKFIAYHKIVVDEFYPSPDQCENFNQFFYRKLKPDKRMLGSEFPAVAVSPTDSRVTVFKTVTDAKKLWIKGSSFSLGALLADDALGQIFQGGSVAIFRLAPGDYHRFHCPVDGVITHVTPIPGNYYTVDSMAIRSHVDIYTENQRSVIVIESSRESGYGAVAVVCVGSMLLGSVNVSVREQDIVKRMDELGFGTSTRNSFEDGEPDWNVQEGSRNRGGENEATVAKEGSAAQDEARCLMMVCQLVPSRSVLICQRPDFILNRHYIFIMILKNLIAVLAVASIGTVTSLPAETRVETTVAARPSKLSDIIKKVVVLVLENRSFDNLAGYYNHTADIDNLIQYRRKTGSPFCNPADTSRPSLNLICETNNSPNVQREDPEHGLEGVLFQLYGKYADTNSLPADFVPPMNGFVQNNGGNQWSIAALDTSLVESTHTLAKSFVLFDKWFSSVPGPTNPNRAFLTSGASDGRGKNDLGFFTSQLPQRSIFQALSEKGISWRNYKDSFFPPDAMFYSWVRKNAASNVVPFKQFFSDAKSGNLPAFSYINPECCSFRSYHAPSPVSTGEDFVKGIYEALRASPSWNETAFIITFDEHGGFADHVPPPRAPAPGDNKFYSYSAGGKRGVFKFDVLGPRVPTFLISPLVPAGVVEHGLDAGGAQYDHTSVLKFLSGLWDIPSFTNRDKAARDFAHLFTLSSPRTDCPLTI